LAKIFIVQAGEPLVKEMVIRDFESYTASEISKQQKENMILVYS